MDVAEHVAEHVAGHVASLSWKIIKTRTTLVTFLHSKQVRYNFLKEVFRLAPSSYVKNRAVW